MEDSEYRIDDNWAPTLYEQIAKASFRMTFVCKGYETKIKDAEKEHEDEPDKKLVISVIGPGWQLISRLCLCPFGYFVQF